MPILIATKEKYMILSSKEDEGGKKNCHKETGQNRNRITTTNKERHFHDMYVFSSSMLSKSLPYSIPFYQRKSLDEKTFPEK